MHWSAWAGKAPTQQKFRQSQQRYLHSEDKSFSGVHLDRRRQPELRLLRVLWRGEVYTGEEDAVEKYDTSELLGALPVAVRILEGIDWC